MIGEAHVYDRRVNDYTSVRALISGKLFIHRGLNDPLRWTLSHAPSGCIVCDWVPLQDLRRIQKELQPLVPLLDKIQIDTKWGFVDYDSPEWREARKSVFSILPPRSATNA